MRQKAATNHNSTTTTRLSSLAPIVQQLWGEEPKSGRAPYCLGVEKFPSKADEPPHWIWMEFQAFQSDFRGEQ